MTNLMKIVAGILIFIISIVLTLKMWWMITALATFMDHAIMTAIYWVGVIMVWTLITLVAPIYLIIKGSE